MKTHRLLPTVILLALSLGACQSDMEQTSTQSATVVQSNGLTPATSESQTIRWGDYVVRSNIALKKMDSPWLLPVEVSGTNRQNRHDIRLSQSMQLHVQHANSAEALQSVSIQWLPANAPHVAHQEAMQLSILLQAANPTADTQAIDAMAYQLLHKWQSQPKEMWQKAWQVDEQAYQVAVSPHLGIQVKTWW